MGEQIPVWGEPSEPVLVELGRLTWAAMNLEEAVHAVADEFSWSLGNRATAGQRISTTLVALAGQPSVPAVTSAVDWLTGAGRSRWGSLLARLARGGDTRERWPAGPVGLGIGGIRAPSSSSKRTPPPQAPPYIDRLGGGLEPAG
jgi:hypothetical protein